MRGREVVDPIPMEVVAQLPIRDRIFVSRKRRDRVWNVYADLAMQEWIVPPGATYAGVLFFAVPQPPRQPTTEMSPQTSWDP